MKHLPVKHHVVGTTGRMQELFFKDLEGKRHVADQGNADNGKNEEESDHS